MKNYSLNIVVAFLFSISSNVLAANHEVSDIKKYKIDLPEKLIQESGGFYPGIGSGLEFHEKLDNGSLEFIAISDRGPNLPIEEDKIVLFYPNFSPKIVKIELSKDGKLEVKSFLNIKYNGRNITGYNINKSSHDEKVYNDHLEPLELGFGLDTESISILKDGDFVVGDEYEASINIIDQKTGDILKRFTPGEGLPSNFANKNYNRGIESLTVTPNGKIYAILESVLNLDNHSVKNAKLIRMLELDLTNNNYRVFAYAFDYDKYKNSSKVKIGDITAIDNENFLLIEQGEAIDGKYRNIIYKINIKEATNIDNVKTSDGKELEFAHLEDLKNIKFINKEFIFNPREHGWKEKKLEGITLVDKSTIAISNDNDFSLEEYKIENISCSHDSKKSCKKVVPIVNKAKQKTDLWLIKFKNIL